MGGQLSEIYPQKPIYGIPGFPSVNAQALVNGLMEQIATLKPGFSLGGWIDSLQQTPDKSFILHTRESTTIQSKVVVITGGLGCFEPRGLRIDYVRRLPHACCLVYAASS